MSKATERAEEVKRATEHLLGILKPGDTVYTILRHVSASGMSREISCVVGAADGSVIDLDYWVATVLDDKIGTHGGIAVVSGLLAGVRAW